MEHPAEQAGQHAGRQVGRMLVAPLHYRQGGFADGEHVSGLNKPAGITAQHGFGVVQHAEQVGAHRQYPAAIALAPTGCLSR